MPSNFSLNDPKEKLIAGLGVFLNPQTLLGGQQISVFDEKQTKALERFPHSLLHKLATVAESCHDTAVGFINMAG